MANEGITRIPFANGSIYPLNILGSEINDPNTYKQNILNQYQDIAKQNNLTYEDSPIFNRGIEAWDPYSLGSQVLQNWSIPTSNFLGSFEDDPSVTYGGAGLMGTKTSAGFKNDILNKIKSGDATEAEKLQFGQTFGHEMSHLGMTYKPRDELINVPGVGEEGGKRAAMLGSIRLPQFLQDKIPGLPGEYEGEEQWNRMHDLIYGGTTDWRTNLADLKRTYEDLPAKSPERKEAFKKAMAEHTANTQKYNPGVAETFLRDSGLIAADKSYTPYGHEKIGWSGLTSESKKALGFGVNPHEDTMMGQMRTYPDKDTGGNMSIEEIRDYFEGIKPEDMGLPKRGEADWEKYMRGEVATVPRLSNEEYLAQNNLYAGSTGNIDGVKWTDATDGDRLVVLLG